MTRTNYPSDLRCRGGMRRYRIEYRPADGWVATGEPIRPHKDHSPPPTEWPVIGPPVASRADAEHRVATWQGRQLILLGVDLLAPRPDLPRTA